MNTILIIVGASLYILLFIHVVKKFGDAAFDLKITIWEKVKPVIWHFILINMLVVPFVLLGKSIGVIGGGIL